MYNQLAVLQAKIFTIERFMNNEIYDYVGARVGDRSSFVKPRENQKVKLKENDVASHVDDLEEHECK